LSELELTLGEISVATDNAELSVNYAEQNSDSMKRLIARITHADTLHQAGLRADAEARFREAEEMQSKRQPDYPLLPSIGSFRYCELLLSGTERAAWQAILEYIDSSPLNAETSKKSGDMLPHSKELHAVSQRVAQTLQWAEEKNFGLLSIALDHLTLGRVALHEAILAQYEFPKNQSNIEDAVNGLYRAGTQQYIPLGLLTRAWLRAIEGKHVGLESAQSDLDEAMEIAERGPMPLYIADIHLHRARLFFRVTPYPWRDPDGATRSAQQDLAEARRLIEKHSYWRRKEELEDAEAVIGKSA